MEDQTANLQASQFSTGWKVGKSGPERRTRNLRPFAAPKEAHDIPGPVNHSDNLNPRLSRVVQDDIAATGKHPQTRTKILTGLTQEWLFSEKRKPLIQAVELSIRRIRIISPDVLPRLSEIRLGLV